MEKAVDNGDDPVSEGASWESAQQTVIFGYLCASKLQVFEMPDSKYTRSPFERWSRTNLQVWIHLFSFCFSLLRWGQEEGGGDVDDRRSDFWCLVFPRRLVQGEGFACARNSLRTTSPLSTPAKWFVSRHVTHNHSLYRRDLLKSTPHLTACSHEIAQQAKRKRGHHPFRFVSNASFFGSARPPTRLIEQMTVGLPNTSSDGQAALRPWVDFSNRRRVLVRATN